MGYRNKIALLNVKTYNNIKDKTYQEIAKKYGDGKYVGCYQIAKEVYEIGKYWEHDFLNKYKKNIFAKKATNRRFNEESEFYIIGKDGLKAIIDSYHKKIAEYYKSILKPDPRDVELGLHTKPEEHIKNQLKEWDNQFNIKPYNLSLDKDEIISSWKYEYSIFELVRIYKTVDESKQLICLTGW